MRIVFDKMLTECLATDEVPLHSFPPTTLFPGGPPLQTRSRIPTVVSTRLSAPYKIDWCFNFEGSGVCVISFSLPSSETA